MPPASPVTTVPLLPSPLVAGGLHPEGYGSLIGHRQMPIHGQFFWVLREELQVYTMLMGTRIIETFFMRYCQEYVTRCDISPEVRSRSLEYYIIRNELCPYDTLLKVPRKSENSKRNTSQRNGIVKTTHEDAARQILRAFKTFEGSVKVSIFTDDIIMLFNVVQRLLQNTLEAPRVCEQPPETYEISYTELSEIKMHMDEIKSKLRESQLHKYCPFKAEDVSHVQSFHPQTPPVVVLNIGTPQTPDISSSTPPLLSPPPINTPYPRDPHKME